MSSDRTLAQRLNNPGLLKYMGQPGASMGERDFCYFENPEDGWKALHRQIGLDASRGLTLEEFIYKYAPETENDTEKYYFDMMIWLSVPEGIMLRDVEPYFLAVCIARKEGYFA